jgi:quercetin dioxygenase-like cupin family protein
MRRFVAPFIAVALVLGGLMAATGIRTTAQEATPATEDGGMMMEGIGFEGLGFGVATTLPEAPAELQLFRIFLEPGATLPFDPADPSTGMGYIEAGTVTINVSEPITVLRAAGAGTPFPEETEEIAADTEFTLNVGDSAVIPAGVEGQMRNDGSEQASILVANVAPPMGEMMEEEDAAAEATPAA